ncbi:outer membrane lipoprotein carrier protein LolA [Algimonas porphyrae]|uniref:Outer-membrane lipoprotein carrier protein n=1 Tax=Algimonas porphyrae TaxID=1128113 RepID=A0ABQ5V186_9PROT|nr:outer membrane lipoprotein carrier protein LolA [Algimonas porphyrae]GLQ20702.1 outer-membrane lipoprotein carrier protein [Algimonas porphyrae]
MKSIHTLSAAALIALAVPAFSTAQDAYAPQPRVQNASTTNLPAFTHPQSVPQDLARVDGGLNATGSFQGRFTQYGADGSVSTGTVHLQRPGRVRFEYDAPNPLLIVSDGVTLVQQDRALETFDRVPLSATPLNYFLKENVNLARDTEVIGFQKLPNQWRVTSRDGSGEMAGAITLVFDPQSLALMEWVIADEFGGTTTVRLSELQYNQALDPRLFILRDQREDRRDRRR